MRLGDVISRQDVAVACALLDHVMRREIVGEDDHANKATKAARRNGGDDDDNGDEDGGDAPAHGRQEQDEEMADADGAAAAPATGAYGAEAPASARARRTKRARDADAAGPSGQEGNEPTGEVAARGRRPRAAPSGLTGDVATALAAAGVQVVPDGHEEAMAAQEASGSEVSRARLALMTVLVATIYSMSLVCMTGFGLTLPPCFTHVPQTYTTLESLTDAVKKAVNEQVAAILEQRGRDDLVELAELKVGAGAGGLPAT